MKEEKYIEITDNYNNINDLTEIHKYYNTIVKNLIKSNELNIKYINNKMFDEINYLNLKIKEMENKINKKEFKYEKNKNNNLKFNILDETINDILKGNNIKNTKNNRYNYKKLLKRSLYLYNIYNEKINNIYFSLNYMYRIPENKWEQWLEYLDIIINKSSNNNFDYISKPD